jgi:serine/threonine-protein kinase
MTATDLFVSYKAEDRARVKPLVDALEAEGFSVWWDVHIGGGTNWREDIEEHLDAAKCVIVAWTKRSVAREGNFVRDEATRAQRRGTYLPVRIDAVDPPLGFGEVQALPLIGWKGDSADPRFKAVADAAQNVIAGKAFAPGRHVWEQSGVSRRAVVGGGVGALAIVAAGGWWLLKPSAAHPDRIAVLPFADLSGAHDQSYFAEGIAEELRSALSRVGLQVIGRASSDAVSKLDTKAAATKLGVGNILTGSVRRSARMVRISAQLVGGGDGVEHWAQSYDRAPGDEIKIQTDIAFNVAQALSVALGYAGKAALTLGGSTDSSAQDLLLQARKLIGQADGPDDMRAALALIDQAIGKDSNYADAYVEKANLLVQLAARYGFSNTNVPKEWADADAAAKKAVALAPQLGPAYSALAELQIGRLDFANGLANLNRAISLAPNNAEVLAIGARELPWLSDANEGLRLADQAIALDPLNGPTYQWRAYALIVLRRFRDAIAAGRKVLEVAPKQLTAHAQIGNSLIALNQLDAAMAEFKQMPAEHPLRMAGEAMIAARKGQITQVDAMVEHMRTLVGPARFQYGQVYTQTGNLDRAFVEFDKAAAAKTPGMIYLRSDPLIEPIRRDPRYFALLRQLNFPGS